MWFNYKTSTDYFLQKCVFDIKFVDQSCPEDLCVPFTGTTEPQEKVHWHLG